MRAKKSLGQNFLNAPSILAKIAGAAELTKHDTVLEVGPGRGALTAELLKHARRVIAVEKDDLLYEFLKEKFSGALSTEELTLIHGDILENPVELSAPYKVVANIPYYITGLLLRKFLSGDLQPTSMVLVIQKEVAERIVARDGKESLLSLSVKIYGEPEFIGKIPRRYFNPMPKVDSAILKISRISKQSFRDMDEKLFFTILHAGFAHKRKVLRKNLELISEKQKIIEVFEHLGIGEHARAEDLDLETWVRLIKTLQYK